MRRSDPHGGKDAGLDAELRELPQQVIPNRVIGGRTDRVRSSGNLAHMREGALRGKFMGRSGGGHRRRRPERRHGKDREAGNQDPGQEKKKWRMGAALCRLKIDWNLCRHAHKYIDAC